MNYLSIKTLFKLTLIRVSLYLEGLQEIFFFFFFFFLRYSETNLRTSAQIFHQSSSPANK